MQLDIGRAMSFDPRFASMRIILAMVGYLTHASLYSNRRVWTVELVALVLSQQQAGCLDPVPGICS